MRKTVRVDIPIYKADDMDRLATSLLKFHGELNAGSPLDVKKIETFKELSETHKLEREKACRLHAEAEVAMQNSKIALGTSTGQNVNTPDTMYYYLSMFRDFLLVEYKGREEELSKFGFNVVIGTAKAPSFSK